MVALISLRSYGLYRADLKTPAPTKKTFFELILGCVVVEVPFETLLYNVFSLS